MARKPRRMPPEKPANAKQSIKNIFSLLTGYKLKLSLTVICGIISTVFSVISPLLIGFATTAIFEGINSGNMNLNHIINLLIAIVVLYIISAVFSYLQSYLLLDITTDISYNLRKDLVEKVTHLSMSDLDINTRGDILSRITNDVRNCPDIQPIVDWSHYNNRSYSDDALHQPMADSNYNSLGSNSFPDHNLYNQILTGLLSKAAKIQR